MGVRWYSIVVDCEDVQAQATWWAEVLGWEKVYEDADEVTIAAQYMLGQPPDERGPGLVFVPVGEAKTVKNRLHIDLAPPAGASQEDEVDRLVALGAKRVDVGQDEAAVSWVVLADPEGNEFCVLSPRD
jgi:catechol 2,3-dioxygenase-like lactoylglutathione lyase family enzyme